MAAINTARGICGICFSHQHRPPGGFFPGYQTQDKDPQSRPQRRPRNSKHPSTDKEYTHRESGIGKLSPYGYEITELGQKRQVTTKRSSQVGIGPRDPVIRVRGTIWNAADQTRAYKTALASRLSREVRLPGWLDSGSCITGVGPRW